MNVSRRDNPASRRTAGRLRPGRRSAAFTLVEMLVSLAVLTVALSVVGVVFTVTTRTASQAAAYNEASGWVRQFMTQLEEDLKNIDTSRSVLVLVGRTQPAALTPDDVPAKRYHRVLVGDPAKVPAGYRPDAASALDPQYSDPRADLLMFFSNRPCTSQAPPVKPPANGTIHQAVLSGAKIAPVQIAYGHASFDAAVNSGSATAPNWAFADNVRHVANVLTDGTGRSVLPAGRWHLARRVALLELVAGQALAKPFSTNEWNRIMRCTTFDAIAGDVGRLDLERLLAEFSAQLRSSPYDTSALTNSANNFFFRDSTAAGSQHVATLLESPPEALRSNLGLHMLPGCAWFQVEFLMPEDPRNSIDWVPPTGPVAGGQPRRDDPPRWTEIPDGQSYVFVPDSPENRAALADTLGQAGGRAASFALLDPFQANTLENRRLRLWPYAIRVTVRVYDPRGRLSEPIVRSLVHKFE